MTTSTTAARPSHPGRARAALSEFQRLIEARRVAYGWSYKEIARRAGVGPDGRPLISRQTMHRYGTKPMYRSPPPLIADAVAHALGVPGDTVRAAIVASLHLDPVQRLDPPEALAVPEPEGTDVPRLPSLAGVLAVTDEDPATDLSYAVGALRRAGARHGAAVIPAAAADLLARDLDRLAAHLRDVPEDSPLGIALRDAQTTVEAWRHTRTELTYRTARRTPCPAR